MEKSSAAFCHASNLLPWEPQGVRRPLWAIPLEADTAGVRSMARGEALPGVPLAAGGNGGARPAAPRSATRALRFSLSC